MPGPSNNKKKSKKTKTQKQKRDVLADKTSRDANQAQPECEDTKRDDSGRERGRSREARPLHGQNLSPQVDVTTNQATSAANVGAEHEDPQRPHYTQTPTQLVPASTPVPLYDPDPFITNRGDGARVTHVRSYLSSFFCPPISWGDPGCTLFAPEEVLTVLRAVVGGEMALVCFFFSSLSLRFLYFSLFPLYFLTYTSILTPSC